jgi:tRNA U34 5-carboxymethylaminomethyl modifying GTPase MnmE/TrmE
MRNLEEHEVQKYENLLLRAQKIKILEREVTFFDSAFRKHHENPTTELLRFFLDPNEVHGLNDTFYKGLTKAIHEEISQHSFGAFQDLAIEHVTEDHKRIDLWIETENTLIVIEAKIDYQQNNPIKSYQKWAKAKVKNTKKNIIYMVLSVEGETIFKDWSALSFQVLSRYIGDILGQQSLKNPLNKWFILAREFLLHLENYTERMETNMDVINFVMRHHNEIQKLFALREQGYDEIKNHLLNQLNIHFQDSSFKVVQEQRYKKTCKGWRFSKEGLKSQSDIALYIHFEEEPMVEVWLCYDMDGKEKINAGKISAKIKKSKDKFSEIVNWAKSNEDTNSEGYKSICWELISFDLDQITKVMIEAQKVLNEFE